MASKLVELKIAMDNLPIGAGENELVAEIQAMLQREYADGVKVSVSLMESVSEPEKLEKPKKADKAA